VVAGWYDGLTSGQVQEAAASCLHRGCGFVLQWWGLVETGAGDHDLAHSFELGDRASYDSARENGLGPQDRHDWVVAKALMAQPRAFADLLFTTTG